MTLLGQASPQGSLMGMFLPLIVIFVIFYFLLIRPQAKQQKKHKSMLEGIKRGDEVILSSGIHGRVQNITDQSVALDIAENCRIRVEKSSIASIKGSTT